MGRADGKDFAFLQRAEQLGLKRQRQFGDFVKEQRSAVSRQEQAVRSVCRAGKAALLMTEQHRFHHGFGKRGAVDGDEVVGNAARLGMKEARHAFLARAGVALDQDGRVAARHAACQRHQACAGGIAYCRDARGAGQLSDQGKGEGHILKTECHSGGQAVGGRHQRRRAVDQVDQNVAMGGMANLGSQQHTAIVTFARRLRIDDAYHVKGIFQPVLQPRNEGADSSADV